MRATKRAAVFAIAAVAVLMLGCFLGVLLPGTYQVWVGAGFVGYVACGRRAMILWRLDDRVFDHPHRHVQLRGQLGRLIAFLLFAAAVAPARALQTIFNVPPGDVLGQGRTEGFENAKVSSPNTIWRMP